MEQQGRGRVLNADGQSLTITLGAEELRLLADELEQWRRQYGV